MENASKALIIAGAILVSILLISIGVLIINSTGDMTDQVGSSSESMSIQTFNSQFTVYEDNEVSAGQVRALISLIHSSNASNGFGGAGTTSVYTTDKYVYLENESGCITKASQVENTKKYKVEITGYSSGGYVQKIKITK